MFTMRMPADVREACQQHMCVINDPLGQFHSPASSDHYLHFKIIVFCSILKSTDVRTTCVKTKITTSRDYGWAEWINIHTDPHSMIYDTQALHLFTNTK